MKIDHNSKGHFQQRVTEYLDHIEELEGYSYTQLAKSIKKATEKVTLISGETYAVVALNGIEFGLGYMIEGDTVYIKTAISPIDVESNRARSFKCKRETITKLIA